METTLTEPAADSGSRIHQIRPEDFDWIVSKHQKRIYRILLFILRDSEAADNLTQECFLRAYEKHKSFRGEAGLETWLVRIAINLAYDQGKSRRLAFWKRLVPRHENSGIEARDRQRSPEQITLAREAAAKVWSAANQLPTQQQTAFLLRFAEEMSLEEIAAAMELEVGTVKSHLSRALGALKQRLQGIR